MSWEQKQVLFTAAHTVLDTWVNQQVQAVSPTNETHKVRNVRLRGIYWVDQGTEVNFQHGSIIVALSLLDDAITAPDLDVDGGGVTRSIKKLMYVMSAGQNNPVLFAFDYRAINVGPGQNLWISTQAKQESSTAINHRVNLAGTFWKSND